MIIGRAMVTTHKGLEKAVGSEVYTVLAELGDPAARVHPTGISGIIMVETSLIYSDVLTALRAMIDREPWRIRYILRLMPLEILVVTDVKAITEAVEPLLQRIGEAETFRVTVEKRHSEISSVDLIRAVAGKVNRKVDLEDPDWIVLIEILGDTTGVSVVRPDQTLRVVREKRGV